MINALMVLLLFQLAGEATVRLLSLPIPGPVMGMVLLLLALLLRDGPAPALKTTANKLLSHLSLLFIPAGVGIMTHGDLLRASWLPLTVILIVSCGVTLAATALSMCWIMRITRRRS
ncbi:MAG: CidA/LrgA family protein [Anaerolineales bacterium]